MTTNTKHKLKFEFYYNEFINETIKQSHEFTESEEGLLADMIRQYMQFLVAVGFQPVSIENVIEEIAEEKAWSGEK